MGVLCRKPEMPQTSRRRPDDITLSPSARNFLAVAHQADQAVADSYSAANAESVEPGTFISLADSSCSYAFLQCVPQFR